METDSSNNVEMKDNNFFDNFNRMICIDFEKLARIIEPIVSQ